jgi:hypothetical protein
VIPELIQGPSTGQLSNAACIQPPHDPPWAVIDEKVEEADDLTPIEPEK